MSSDSLLGIELWYVILRSITPVRSNHIHCTSNMGLTSFMILSISVARRCQGVGGQLPPTGPGLDPEIRANPMRSRPISTKVGWVGDEYGKDCKSLRPMWLENTITNVMIYEEELKGQYVFTGVILSAKCRVFGFWGLHP